MHLQIHCQHPHFGSQDSFEQLSVHHMPTEVYVSEIKPFEVGIKKTTEVLRSAVGMTHVFRQRFVMGYTNY